MIGLIETPAKQASRQPGTFKPGQSGNPKGRPRKGESLSEIVRMHAKAKVKGRSRLSRLIERLYHEDPKTYLAYGWGKPVESVELTGPQGEPVEFKVAIGVEELP